MLCYKCGGTGKYLGIGMMMADCYECIESPVDKSIGDEKPLAKIDRRSKAYINAINEIMNINSGISKEEAVKMFDKAYDKV